MWCEGVGRLTGAAQRVGGAQVIVASLTAVTAGTFNIHFTLAGACAVVTPAPIHCPLSTADTAWQNMADMSHSSIILSTLKYVFNVDFEPVYTVACEGPDLKCFLTNQWTTYVCRHQDGPFGCGGLAGSPGHTGHILALLCGAYSPHTHLHSSTHWPRTLPDQNDSAGRGCYTDSLRRGRKG